jgi:CMP-2-keto-3-deoxyoctulosonic acid synthetase
LFAWLFAAILIFTNAYITVEVKKMEGLNELRELSIQHSLEFLRIKQLNSPGYITDENLITVAKKIENYLKIS